MLNYYCFTALHISNFLYLEQKEARNDGGETQIPMACTSGNNSSNFTEHGVINSY
jgi:hypothetical protein